LIDTFKATFRKSCANLLFIKVEQNTLVQPLRKVAQKTLVQPFLKVVLYKLLFSKY